jgi:hypothetical protein
VALEPGIEDALEVPGTCVVAQEFRSQSATAVTGALASMS